LPLQVIERHVLRLQLAVELLLSEGSLDFGELGIDLLVGCDEIELGGALLLDFIVDEMAEYLQARDLGPVTVMSPVLVWRKPPVPPSSSMARVDPLAVPWRLMEPEPVDCTFAPFCMKMPFARLAPPPVPWMLMFPLALFTSVPGWR